MRRLERHIALFILWSFPLTVLAQETKPDAIIESIIESHLENLEEGTDVALIIEDLENLAENPININATSADELARLYIPDNIQINKLLDYIKTYGPAYSIYELNTIDGFNPEILKKMEPFIWFGPKSEANRSFRDELKYGKHQILSRALGTMQKARGYLAREDGSVPYEGNRFRYYSRYSFEVRNKLSVGITAEKDPGEAFFKGSNKHGFDYYSGHVSFKLNNTVENISVGDFVVRSGQGLVLWQGYTNGKSEDIMAITKNGQGTRGYTSVDENLFFRGISTLLNFGDAKLNLFYSNKKSDANLVTSESKGEYFTSLQTSGYHRTTGEIEDEKSVINKNWGGFLTWNFQNLKVGGTFVYQKFNVPFYRTDQLYNLFRFEGTENYTTGIDYLWNKGRLRLFGEAAMSKSKGKAITQGMITRLNDQLSFSALFRHFDKNYHALWANTFAEAGNISNESGLYLGTRFLPAKHVTLSAYSDIYQSSWVNYSTAGPARSWDIFAQASFQVSEKFSFYTRFKNEEKEQKFKKDRRYVNLPERIQKLRLHFQYKPNEIITLKSRIEHVYYKGQETENGFLIFQDIQFSPLKFPVDLSARLAWFDTESYNSRIYAYENDILYTFSIPAYYGRGFRTYLNLKYEITDKLDCWAKISNTHYTDREIISSGHNEIQGNNKTELKFQLRLKF